jgi:CHAT domain-containing protein/tetratricopeptide (TPR) repeat protein
MIARELVDELLTLPDVATQRYFLKEQTSLLNDEVASLLKEQADHFLRADIRISLEIANLLTHIAELTRNPLYRALGLLVEANARSIGLGEYARAIELYDQAAEIYRSRGYIAEQARSQIGKVNALPHLGRFGEALDVGHWAGQILEEHEQWLPLVKLIMNLGTVHGRQNEDIESLAMFDRAYDLYIQKGFAGKTEYAQIQLNRAVILRNLGRFDASIEASRLASDALLQLDEAVEAARAEQGLALTYFVLGRFNEALELLDHVREVFLADGRQRDAMLVELYLSDCLLQLRRFPEVIEKCRRVRGLFAELGTRQVEALAIINEAVAYAELRRYDEALASLSDAQRIFQEAGNEVRVASTDLEKAAVFLCQERYAEALAVAQECIEVFRVHQLPIEVAQAFVVAARAALALEQSTQAHVFLLDSLQIGQELNIPTVRYQAHSLLGALANAQGDVETAQKELDRAIQEMEQLRGRLMVEFRVSFLEDKESLYQDMVEICINQGEPLRGLEYTERAKSRALLDLLAYRLDLTVQARNAEDRPVVEQLARLRAERDQLYRRWESDAEAGENNERGWSSSQSIRQKAQQDVLALEQQITELWHRLLVRNADYAREAALWTVRTESAQPYLDNDTLLVEYYVVHGGLVVFLVTDSDVKARRLDGDLSKIQSLMQRLQLNLRTVPKSPLPRLAALTSNAQALLHQLYQLLIAPLEDQIAGYSKLMIVPHGPLHYLPFHALYNGASYLIERHEISYLPNASSLRYCREERPATNRSLAVGYSNGGRLPHAVEEARDIATILDGQVLLEEGASLAEFYQAISECRTLHLATHGDFRLDNPLFSGLAFSDGWLTTMDIFDLRLKASLVTLSACQTGRNVLGGGDELLGLMRAFLSAGTASVALTLWAVEDRSTAQIMETFYRHMAEGRGKGESLRHAQLQFIRGVDDPSGARPQHYVHPYFWAPFFLVGDAGPL